MPSVTIYPANRETLVSGVAITDSADTASIKIDDMVVRLRFVGGNVTSVPEVKFDLISPTELELQLTHFVNPLGTAWLSAIGELNGRRMYLGLAVYQIGNEERATRVVHYDLTVGETVGQ